MDNSAPASNLYARRARISSTGSSGAGSRSGSRSRSSRSSADASNADDSDCSSTSSRFLGSDEEQDGGDAVNSLCAPDAVCDSSSDSDFISSRPVAPTSSSSFTSSMNGGSRKRDSSFEHSVASGPLKKPILKKVELRIRCKSSSSSSSALKPPKIEEYVEPESPGASDVDGSSAGSVASSEPSSDHQKDDSEDSLSSMPVRRHTRSRKESSTDTKPTDAPLSSVILTTAPIEEVEGFYLDVELANMDVDGPSDENTKPIRLLEGFMVHELSDKNHFLLISEITEEEDYETKYARALGHILPVFDEAEDDDCVVEPVHFQTSLLRRHDIAFNEQDGSVTFWLLSEHSWFQLGTPHQLYEEKFLMFAKTALIAAFLFDVALNEEKASKLTYEELGDMIQEYVTHCGLLRVTFEKDLFLIVLPDVADVIDVYAPESLKKLPLIAKILRYRGQIDAPQANARRAASRRRASAANATHKELMKAVQHTGSSLLAGKPKASSDVPTTLCPLVNAMCASYDVFQFNTRLVGIPENFEYPIPEDDEEEDTDMKNLRNGVERLYITNRKFEKFEVFPGTIVTTFDGQLAVVQSIDAEKGTVHVIHIRHGKETILGHFAGELDYYAICKCETVQKALLRPYSGKNEIPPITMMHSSQRLECVKVKDKQCFVCTKKSHAPNAKLLNTLTLNPNHSLLLNVGGLAERMFPSIKVSGLVSLCYNKKTYFVNDYVYVRPTTSFLKQEIAKLGGITLSNVLSLYMIARIKEINSDNNHVVLSLLGRWNSLRKDRESENCPRRLFRTSYELRVKREYLVGHLSVLPRNLVRSETYFKFPHNFTLDHTLRHHDPRKYLLIDRNTGLPYHSSKPKRNTENDEDDEYAEMINLYPNESVRNFVNRSPGMLQMLNTQCQMLVATSDGDKEDVFGMETKEEVTKIKKLRALDLFSGCGGLTVGFDNDIVPTCDTKYAVEMSKDAVQTFQRNFPSSKVYTVDCNKFLADAINVHARKKALEQYTEEERKANPDVHALPKMYSQMPLPGDVDAIYCGPPCQGFSGLNQFRKSEDDKNNLIASSLSFVEFYRPKVFLLENVVGLLSYPLGGTQATKHRVEGGVKTGVLRFIIRTLTALGYQTTWSVLQAANYGAPQNRRRVIIMATLPHVKLPEWPECTHVFVPTTCNVAVNDKEVVSLCNTQFGLFPTVTVHEAISDLAPFEYTNPNNKMQLPQDEVDALYTHPPVPRFDAVSLPGGSVRQIVGLRTQGYSGPPMSEYQRHMRGKVSKRKQSAVKKEKDSENIASGYESSLIAIESDNESDLFENDSEYQTLCFNHYTRPFTSEIVERISHILKYPGADHSTLPGPLKPWALSHPNSAAARHNGWKGLYGRLNYDGWFKTATTDMNPMAKTGTILHPVLNRILSVRESARSQGFPDTFQFFSLDNNIGAMYRQVGNAVPPIMAAAINREVLKALLMSPYAHLSESEYREKKRQH